MPEPTTTYAGYKAGTLVALMLGSSVAGGGGRRSGAGRMVC
jgi:hypothetical protein